jgi:calcium-binding protein CML
LVCIYPDEDSNGEIDQLELKHCFQNLGIESTDQEIKDLFQACDIYENMGMKFNEFIVFLCLVYLLDDPAVSEVVSLTQYKNICCSIFTFVSFFSAGNPHDVLMFLIFPESDMTLNLWYVFT